jgi:NDP-sugar pyrophosphorylase family protein
VQAVILAGGQGTRLLPLTLARPKPLVPLLNTPFLYYQIGLLRQHGIRDIVVSCSDRWEMIRNAMGNGDSSGVRLRYAIEPQPLGTGGGVRNAASLADGRVIVMNGDALTDMDLSAMVAAHARRQAEATIALITVDDPREYGLVETDRDGRVRRFVEKPDSGRFTARTVNAGVYILERELIDLIPSGQVVSLEREFFPLLLTKRVPFFGWNTGAYWLDIGTPQRYRQAHLDLLSGALHTPVTPPGIRSGNVWMGEGTEVAPGAILTGPAVLGLGVRLATRARVDPFSVLGDRCIVEAGGVVEASVLWEEVQVGVGASLRNCVVGAGCRIGAHCRVEPGVVVGGGVIPDFSHLCA